MQQQSTSTRHDIRYGFKQYKLWIDIEQMVFEEMLGLSSPTIGVINFRLEAKIDYVYTYAHIQ